MSNLRGIVKKHQEEKVLREFLGEKYDSTHYKEKEKFLKAVESSVDREVTSILDAFINEAMIGSPENNRRKSRAILNLIVTVICTPGIAYGVNLTNWVLVILFSLVLVSVQIYIIKNEF